MLDSDDLVTTHDGDPPRSSLGPHSPIPLDELGAVNRSLAVHDDQVDDLHEFSTATAVA